MITVRLIRALKFRQRWCVCVHSRAGDQSLRAAPVDPENGSSTASVFTTGAGIGMSAKHFVSIHRSTLFCPLCGVTCVEIHGHPWLCPFPRAAGKCGGKYRYAATESGRSSRGSSPCGECPARQDLSNTAARQARLTDDTRNPNLDPLHFTDTHGPFLRPVN